MPYKNIEDKRRNARKHIILVMDREKLAMRMWAHEFLVSGVVDIKSHWNMVDEFMKDKYLERADAIISAKNEFASIICSAEKERK